jgi:hypothetical protein
MTLWAQGEYDLDDYLKVTNAIHNGNRNRNINILPSRYTHYMKYFKQQQGRQHDETTTTMMTTTMGWSLNELRGGDQDDRTTKTTPIQTTIQRLKERYGKPFIEAIELNEKEHYKDCTKSCQYYYCSVNSSTSDDTIPDINDVLVRSYSFGAVPPEDFSEEFGFPLDLIKVTHGKTPILPKEEALRVVHIAETEEGLSNNEFPSGKYRLGGNWLTELPQTRRWFNSRLRTTLFPLLASLFPQIIRDTSVLRAHSVSLLKYNATHPRTDIHIDNGILAMTIAMTPVSHYKGGGTFYEHFTNASNHVLEMDVGHATFRPGSIRHGGHRVVDGQRYVLGAFVLIEDRIEHVRRLKNRGSDLRRDGHLDRAAEHFMWALELNP